MNGVRRLMTMVRNLADPEIILFDLDGTLTDSRPGIIKSAQYALAKMGITVTDPEELKPFIGPPLHDSFRHLYGLNEEQVRQAIVYYRERFAPIGIYENDVYPGIPELLAKLTGRGKRLFIATSKAEVFAQQVAEHFQIQQYFEAVVGSNLDGTRTAKADVIGYLIASYGLDRVRERIVMIGDRKHDLIGAHANRIAAIGVTYGYGTVEELKQYGPTALAGSVAALGDLLTRGVYLD
jgi:phosphoglycolate phosphatase